MAKKSSTTPAPLSPAQKKIADEAAQAAHQTTLSNAMEAKAKAEKQVLDTQKAALELSRAQWTAPMVSPLDGKIESKGNFIETQVLAVKCLEQLMDNFIKHIQTTLTQGDKSIIPSLIFYNAANFESIELYKATFQQLEGLENILNNAILSANNALGVATGAGGGSLPMLMTAGLAAAGILRSGIDILSLFRINTTIDNHEIPMDEYQLLSIFSAKILSDNKNWKLYFPSTYPIETFNKNAAGSNLINKLSAVEMLSTSAKKLLGKIEAAITAIDLKINGANPVPFALTQQREKLIKSQLDLQNCTTLFDQQQTVLLTLDPLKGSSLIGSLLKAEKFLVLLQKDNHYVIRLSGKLSGSTHIRQWLLSSLATKYSGGAELQGMLFKNDGTIAAAFSEIEYSKQRTAEEIFT